MREKVERRSVVISAAVLAEVKRLAEAAGVTASEWIRQAVEVAVGNAKNGPKCN